MPVTRAELAARADDLMDGMMCQSIDSDFGNCEERNAPAGDWCAVCVAAALAAPPASAPPGLVEVVGEFQRARANYRRAKHEDIGQEDAWARLKAARDAVLAYPLPASPQAKRCGCGPSDVCRDEGCQCACHGVPPQAKEGQ